MALRPRKRVGVIGLGIIGSRVAAALRASGHQVFVWNRTPRLEPNFLGSPAELAKVSPVIQIFVADGEALIGTIEALQGELTSDHVILGHSTVSPETAREAAELVAKAGAKYLDAPFTGSRLAAESRQIVYYIGGPMDVLDRVRGVLMSSAKQIIRMGDVGQASVVKIATNLVTAATIEGLAEAMALVQKAGIDPKFFTEATVCNANYSPVIALKLPKMIAEDFEPHFSVKNMFKDLHLALRLADQAGVRIPATEVIADTLFEGLKQGWGDLDFSATVKRYLPEELYPVETPHIPVPPPVEEPQDVRYQPPTPAPETPVAAEPAPVPTAVPAAAAPVPQPPKAVSEQLPLPVDILKKALAETIHTAEPKAAGEPVADVSSDPTSTEETSEGAPVPAAEEAPKPEEPKKKKRGFRLFGRKTAAK